MAITNAIRPTVLTPVRSTPATVVAFDFAQAVPNAAYALSNVRTGGKTGYAASGDLAWHPENLCPDSADLTAWTALAGASVTDPETAVFTADSLDRIRVGLGEDLHEGVQVTISLEMRMTAGSGAVDVQIDRDAGGAQVVIAAAALTGAWQPFTGSATVGSGNAFDAVEIENAGSVAKTIQVRNVHVYRSPSLDAAYVATTGGAVFGSAPEHRWYAGACLAVGRMCWPDQFTQHALQAMSPSAAAWVKSNIGSTVETNMFGLSQGDVLLFANAANSTILQSFVLPSAERTAVFWLKQGASTAGIEITDDGGTTWVPVANRLSPDHFTEFRITTTQANPSIGARLVSQGGQVIWGGLHLVDGAPPSIPVVPTGGAAVTFQPDAYQVANVSWFTPAKGTLVVEAALYNDDDNEQPVVAIHDDAANFFLLRGRNSGNANGRIDAGTNQASLEGGTPFRRWTEGYLDKAAMAWDMAGAGEAEYVHGGAPANSDAAVAEPGAPTKMTLGHRGIQNATVAVKSVTFHPAERKAQAELITLTTGFYVTDLGAKLAAGYDYQRDDQIIIAGAGIDTMNDLSANGLTARQTDDARRFAYTTPAAAVDGFGQAVGVDDWLDIAAAWVDPDQPHELWEVAAPTVWVRSMLGMGHTTGTGQVTMQAANTAGQSTTYYTNDAAVSAQRSTADIGDQGPNYIFHTVFDGTQFFVEIVGHDVSSRIAPPAGPISCDRSQIGANGDSGSAYHGTKRMVVAIAGNLTALERAQLIGLMVANNGADIAP